MNFIWLRKKKKEYPVFWQEYLDGFTNQTQKGILNTRFIAFDTETTGFDTQNDRILSIGAVSLTNKSIHINENFEIYIKQDIFKAETVKIHGIMKNSDLPKVTEIEAIKKFIVYIKNDVLIAHHASFDYAMMNQMLLRNGLSKLKNKCIDTGVLYKKSQHIIYQNNNKNYSLDELCEELIIRKTDRHTATGDALITAFAFLKICSRLNKTNKFKWKTLLK